MSWPHVQLNDGKSSQMLNYCKCHVTHVQHRLSQSNSRSGNDTFGKFATFHILACNVLVDCRGHLRKFDVDSGHARTRVIIPSSEHRGSGPEFRSLCQVVGHLWHQLHCDDNLPSTSCIPACFLACASFSPVQRETFGNVPCSA